MLFVIKQNINQIGAISLRVLKFLLKLIETIVIEIFLYVCVMVISMRVISSKKMPNMQIFIY